jgi:asparagine N-glycosylation enzyme membrane subunit Stt3
MITKLVNNAEVYKFSDGTKHYRLNNLLHREDGPAIERYNGDKEWYIKGRLHRENGPALDLANGYKAWYKNGLPHRIDGPASEYYSVKSWWMNGIQISCKTQEEFERLMRLKAFW